MRVHIAKQGLDVGDENASMHTRAGWFQAITAESPDAVFIFDDHGTARYANQTASNWLGRADSLVTLPNLLGVFKADDRARFVRALARDTEWEPSVYELRGCAGRTIYAEARVHGSPRSDEWVLVLRDLSAERTRDALTGLRNRVWLEEELSLRRDNRFSLIAIGLDRFRDVLQRFGHEAAQELIRTCAERIARAAAPHVVARLEGVSFAVLLPALGPATVELLVERLQSELEAPCQLLGREVRTTASVGMTFSEHRFNNPELALRAALAALHHSQQEHGSRSRTAFKPEMLQDNTDRLDLEQELRDALANDGLALHYQPIIDVESNRVVGYEALLRWFHPTRGFVPPPVIIEMAEQADMMLDLGYWVIHRAARQVQAWNAEHPDAKRLTVNINLAAQQLTRGDLLADVQKIIADTGVAPHQLNFEVTETSIIENPQAAAATLRELRAGGIRLSLDDFGTGYSSLSYLHQFEFDTIKIDRSFIAEIGSEQCNAKQVELTRTLIRLGQGLKLRVVAEGIETSEQLEFLHREGCGHAQGYFFSRPLPPADALKMLN